MNPTRRVGDAIRTRLQLSSLSYLGRHFSAPFFDSGQIVAEHGQATLQQAGVELEKVLATRADTRSVFLVRRGFDQEPVRAYFLALRNWSEHHDNGHGRGMLERHEIREICNAYIMKAYGQVNRISSVRLMRAVARFGKARKRLVERIAWLYDAAERIQIPRGRMCGDMGNTNVLVQSSTRRVFNIDYETMGPGYRGFDCAYFLSSLAKLDDPPEAVRAIRSIALTDEYLDGTEVREFFVVLTAVLSDLSRMVYGTGRHTYDADDEWPDALADGARSHLPATCLHL